MNLRWLLLMRRWADRPPSKQRVMVIAGVIVAALLIVGIEHLGYWPDWATIDPQRRRLR